MELQRENTGGKIATILLHGKEFCWNQNDVVGASGRRSQGVWGLVAHKVVCLMQKLMAQVCTKLITFLPKYSVKAKSWSALYLTPVYLCREFPNAWGKAYWGGPNFLFVLRIPFLTFGIRMWALKLPRVWDKELRFGYHTDICSFHFKIQFKKNGKN